MNQEKIYHCSDCKLPKPEGEFNKSKTSKNGLQYKCRKCESNYRIKNREHRLKKARERYKQYYRENAEIIKNKTLLFRENNRQFINKRARELYSKEKRHKTYLKNKGKSGEYSKNYRINNLERYRKYQREWTKNKRKSDPHYLIQHRLRNRLNDTLKNGYGTKLASFRELIGCTLQELKIYIEAQFTAGMSWDLMKNGEIVIDHILPCCSFDLNKREEQLKCFNYLNLRPLWKEDNSLKILSDLKLRINKNL